MIELSDVTLKMRGGACAEAVLEDCSFGFPVCGSLLVTPKPAHPRALIDLACDVVKPLRGRVTRAGRVSWPIGRLHAFRTQLSGADTIEFLCRLYDLDWRGVVNFVKAFPGVDLPLQRPVVSYPVRDCMKFAQILALAVEFDTYTIDGPLMFGLNDEFCAAWEGLFKARVAGKTLIVSSFQPNVAQAFCQCAVAVEEGRLHLWPDLAAAMARYPLVRPAVEASRSSESVEQDSEDI